MLLYKIINKLTNKIYIGQTTSSLKQRLYGHFNKHNNSAISKAIQKYGKDNFEIQVIAKANSIDELNHRETYYIKLFNSLAPNGYNLRTGGYNSKLSNETKEKLRLKNLGRKASLETRQKMSKTRIGKKLIFLTQEQIEQRKLKEQERCKLKFKPKKVDGWINPQIGKTISKESKLKNAIAHGAKSFIMKDQNNITIWQGYIISECARHFNLSVGNISECLRGRRKQHKNFTFRYAEGS